MKEKNTEKRIDKTGLKKKKDAEIAEASCKDRDCPFHGKLKTRGRTFEGEVKSKFHRRISIEFGRMRYIKKYERYAKSRTKIHARLPRCMEDEINIGDTVLIKECRPLSKIIHFVVIKKIKSGEKLK